MTPQPAPEITLKHLPQLDGLRGIAILMVLLVHFTVEVEPGTVAESLVYHLFLRHLWTGVDLFFVLSGFLITRILIVTKGNHGHLKHFYVRRFLRIFPLYYVVLFLVFVVYPRVSSDIPDSFWAMKEQRIWLVLYAGNFLQVVHEGNIVNTDVFWLGHFWSLCVEEHFYLIWPIIVKFCRTPRGLLHICCWGCLSAVLLRFVLLEVGYSPSDVYRMTPCRIDALLAGAALACLCCSGDRRLLAIPPRWVSAGVGVSVASMSGIGIFSKGYTLYARSVALYGLSINWILFVCILLIALRAKPGSAIYLGLTNSLLMVLGKYSYGIYVWHVLFSPVSYVAADLRVQFGFYGATILSFLFGSGIALALAFVSYHLIERPFLRLKSRFAYSGAAV